jgi:hypothetical protein
MTTTSSKDDPARRPHVATLPGGPRLRSRSRPGRPAGRCWTARLGWRAAAAPVVRTPALVLAALAPLLAALAPGPAGAVELHSDGCCAHGSTTVVAHPVVHVEPPQVVHVKTSSPEVVVVESESTAEVEKEVDAGPTRDLSTSIEARAGAGMWIIPGLREEVNLGYNLDLALSMRGFLVGLDFTWIHGLKWDRATEQTCVESGNLALVGMKLGYRFNEDGRVHPELSARFDTLVLDRKSDETALAFGVGGSAAIVADFPLAYGAIVTALEVAGHGHVWSQNGFYPPRASVAVMGSVGYRF